MKPENKNLLEKSVDVLKKFGFKTEDIMVTGSIALDILGVLPSIRTSHDADFIIKMDDQSWRCLKLLEAINKCEIESKYPDDKSMVILNIKNLKINIWKHSSNFDWSTIKDTNTGVMVATVDHIIRAKKTYARVKDYQDINEIAKTILSI